MTRNLDAKVTSHKIYETEVVVSHFNDNLGWIDTYADMLPKSAYWTFYCKNVTTMQGPHAVVGLPNVGREVCFIAFICTTVEVLSSWQLSKVV